MINFSKDERRPPSDAVWRRGFFNTIVLFIFSLFANVLDTGERRESVLKRIQSSPMATNRVPAIDRELTSGEPITILFIGLSRIRNLVDRKVIEDHLQGKSKKKIKVVMCGLFALDSPMIYQIIEQTLLSSRVDYIFMEDEMFSREPNQSNLYITNLKDAWEHASEASCCHRLMML